jgi:hypothetical protein
LSLGIILGVWANCSWDHLVGRITLDRLVQIESLGHGKRFGCWVELSDNSCNPIGTTLCNLLI